MITVVSYNTMSAVKREEIKESLRKINEIAQLKDGSFFIGLQETRNTEGNSNIRAVISSIFEKYHAEFHLSNKASFHDLGVVLVSKDRPRKITKLELPRLRSWLWRKLFSLKSGVPQYGSIIGEYELDGKVITVVTLHLDVFGGIKQRAAQVEAIKDALMQFSTEHCVIMGDFNTRDPKIVQDLFGDEFTLLGNPGEHTASIKNAINPEIPGSALIQKIVVRTGLDISFRSDWILTKNLSLISEGVEYSCFGSDHYPVWAKLDFKS